MTNGSDAKSIGQAYRDAQQQFRDAGLETPDIDAALLLEHASDATTIERITRPERQMTGAQISTFANFVERRIDREPVHRIIGEREFYGLALGLNEATLIPRPDTEILVDMVLPFVQQCIKKSGRCSILDLGTGTGAIALAILSQAPKATATITDLEPKALEMALTNAERHQLQERVTSIQSDWFENVSERYDLILSNPPYIASEVIKALSVDVRDYDPHLALDGGETGLDAYSIISSQCASYLKTDGRIAVEIGFDQKNSVTKLFNQAGFKAIEARTDLNRNNRALFFT
ncbi:peptide chain release factor N(5)-glutamine methyltransferase [Ahrensia marina]|uniref:Release factor glutamine methyltransferase n=1 Tax=Ahrensia marina TaxID=1514904 RepID=A0A0M9GLK3_9HYPH|nr:peptide chain release factor N(5)-glutamine methyltransferase [Ahrensia marina]KPB00276.1 SAM-dependent methyltransferase [Ahrensia marina]